MWGGLFSLTDCLMIHLRNKEDFWNPIIAGFATGGVLAIRGTRLRLNLSKKREPELP